MNDYLLIDGTQIPVLSELAQVIGLNEAIVVQEVYYWCKVNKREGRKTHQGYYWVYNSYREWTNNHFPWWNEKTVKNIFTRLENRGLLVSGNFNASKMDRTKWYRVNFPELRKIILASGKICPMDWDGITQPIPDIKPGEMRMEFLRRKRLKTLVCFLLNQTILIFQHLSNGTMKLTLRYSESSIQESNAARQSE